MGKTKSTVKSTLKSKMNSKKLFGNANSSSMEAKQTLATMISSFSDDERVKLASNPSYTHALSIFSEKTKSTTPLVINVDNSPKEKTLDITQETKNKLSKDIAQTIVSTKANNTIVYVDPDESLNGKMPSDSYLKARLEKKMADFSNQKAPKSVEKVAELEDKITMPHVPAILGFPEVDDVPQPLKENQFTILVDTTVSQALTEMRALVAQRERFEKILDMYDQKITEDQRDREAILDENRQLKATIRNLESFKRDIYPIQNNRIKELTEENAKLKDRIDSLTSLEKVIQMKSIVENTKLDDRIAKILESNPSIRSNMQSQMNVTPTIPLGRKTGKPVGAKRKAASLVCLDVSDSSDSETSSEDETSKRPRVEDKDTLYAKQRTSFEYFIPKIIDIAYDADMSGKYSDELIYGMYMDLAAALRNDFGSLVIKMIYGYANAQISQKRTLHQKLSNNMQQFMVNRQKDLTEQVQRIAKIIKPFLSTPADHAIVDNMTLNFK